MQLGKYKKNKELWEELIRAAEGLDKLGLGTVIVLVQREMETWTGELGSSGC
jgi:hypothetical protein